MKKIGVVVNVKRPRAEGILSEFRRLAEGHGFELFAEDQAMAGILGAAYVPIEDFPKEVDVVLAMGGDGTVLYTARALHGTGVPIMGINLGSLGFLTSVGDTEITVALAALANQQLETAEREMATCRIFKDGSMVGEEASLNDIVLGWGGSSRIVTLKLSIDEEPISSFMCDGMIVSTPTAALS